MKDTYLPLDMIWIDKKGEVVNMAIYVPPCMSDPCPIFQPPENSRYVLEINAGFSEKWGIKPGDRIIFK